jgi:hypothetical protein
MKKIVIVLLVLLCFSCKDKKDGENTNTDKISKEVDEPKKVEPEDTFKILMDVKVLEDDKFDVFYVGDSPEGSFDSKKRVDGYVKGGNEFQLLTVKLPKGILPYKLRIDLGDNINKHETNIEVRSFKLQFNNRTIELDNAALDSLFSPNIYLQKIDNGYSRKIIDGKYDPFLIANQALINKIETEL